MGPRRRKKYTKEFKLEAVKLSYQEGVTVVEVARDLGIKENLLYNWRNKYADEIFGEDGHRNETMEEQYRRLQRKYRRVLEEREILKKAIRYFAKEE